MLRTKKSAILKENLFGEDDIPDAIFTSDWHLRDTIPSCRQEEFENAQWKKVAFISELQRKYKCPVFHAGDLFDNWKPSPYLLAKTIKYLPDEFCTIYGNHDLPQHNLDLQYKCGIHVLESARKLYVLDGEHWGQSLVNYSIEIKNRKILIWHIMCYQGVKPFPGCIDIPAGGLLRKNKNCDVIVTGHNHQSFVERYDGRILINPGSITRQTVDQAEFKPKVYLYFAKTNDVRAIELPINTNVVQKEENALQVKERDERISAFISKLNTEWDSSINFELNIERFLSSNDIDKEVKKKIYAAMDH